MKGGRNGLKPRQRHFQPQWEDLTETDELLWLGVDEKFTTSYLGDAGCFLVDLQRDIEELSLSPYTGTAGY